MTCQYVLARAEYKELLSGTDVLSAAVGASRRKKQCRAIQVADNRP